MSPFVPIDAAVELPVAAAPQTFEQRIEDSIRTVDHTAKTRDAEQRVEIAEVRAAVEGFTRVELALGVLTAEVKVLGNRLIPAAWSGVLLGTLVGWALSEIIK